MKSGVAGLGGLAALVALLPMEAGVLGRARGGRVFAGINSRLVIGIATYGASPGTN